MDSAKKYKKAESTSILGQYTPDGNKLKRIIEKQVEDIYQQMVKNLWLMSGQFDSWMPYNYKEIMNEVFEIWATYLKYEIEKYEKDRFTGEIPTWKDEQITDLKMRAAFWKSRDIFEGINHIPWKFRISKNALLKFKDWYKNYQKILLKKMIEFSIGYILDDYNCNVLKNGPCVGMVGFSFPILDKETVSYYTQPEQVGIAMCLIEKFPVVKDGKVIKYSYDHFIQLIDIMPAHFANDGIRYGPEIIDSFCDEIRNDPDRWIEYSEWLGDLTINKQLRNVGDKYYPIRIPDSILTEEESEVINFDENLGKWIWRDPDILDKKLKNENFKNKLVELLSKENSCNDFIRFLKTLPNMAFRLTDEQLELISTPGSVLTIGRSGTGKTTCSLLRMFSSEILFRYKMLKNKKLKSEDVDKPSALHFIFVTASPVLTNEVKIYYKKLNDLIKDGLEAKEKAARIDVEEEKVEEIKLERQYSELSQAEEIEEDINTGPHTMNMLADEDFPLFATIRKLVLMIDGSLERPFFSRDKNGRVIGSSSNFEWHNEIVGALEIGKAFKKKRKEQSQLINDDSDLDENKLAEESKSNSYNKQKYDDNRSQKKSWEINFKAFSEQFFPTLPWQQKFSSLILWTEIQAYIKGSPKAYLSDDLCLEKEEYFNLGRRASMLTQEDKKEVYGAFKAYESWKGNNNGYDFQDIVNYILREIHFHGYKGTPIHFMMVDEVQDLTPATLTLLLEVTDQKLFFSGDTAQTIAKGVGFRFCDLKNLFFESSMKAPIVRQLTINFRSHNQILELANSVVALLETLFPATIDKMGKEKSLKDGPHPIIINSGNPSDLCDLLLINGESPEASNIIFGCNQVIIVRNQESKSKIHRSLKSALCLTVYEAKGLEFDDVILYNFFTDSELPIKHWKALDYIGKIEDQPNYKPSSLEDLENMVPKLLCSKIINIQKYSLLCSELKQLYVAITRPKARLIIYDDKPEAREKMQNFWEKIGQSSFQTQDELRGSLFQTFAKSSSKEEWIEQGLRMMSHQFYEQAVKCFRAADDIMLEKKALAYLKATKASEILVEERKSLNTKTYRKERREELEKARNEFISAGNEFLSLSEMDESGRKTMLKEAARCFASAREHAKAADIFQSIGLNSQAAEAFLACGLYEAAGNLFTEKFEYARAINAYKCGRKWDKLVHCIYKCRNNMTDEERKKYIKKYVPVALEALISKVLPTLGKDTQYINKIAEEDKNIIPEENEEEDKEENQENNIEENEKEYEIENEEEYEEEDKKENEILKDELLLENHQGEESFSLIQDSNNTSFTLLEKSSSDSFSIIKDEDQIYEILQDVDPEDEWLQSDSGSVIDSLGSTINKEGTILSDYSIIDNVHAAALNQGGKLINTKTDIFIEDQAMRKIIEYVGMFSSDVSLFLKAFKSAESLISTQEIAESWELASLVDLDEISPELLGIILDILEEFGMYKMCLFVCNRYHLEGRLGRYIVSLAFKYSNNSILKPNDISRPFFMKAQYQRASIAYGAVHNILEMINPEYLYLKRFLDGKNLGIESFRGLLLLGYWKKTVYIMDKENSLAVTSSFMDYKNFKHIYLTFENPDNLTKINEESFAWLPFVTPSNEDEVKAAKIALDSVVCNLNALHFVTQKFNSATTLGEMPNFPEYFVFNEIFWKFINKKDESLFMNYLRQSFGLIKDILQGKSFKTAISELRAWDALSFFTQLLLGSAYQPSLKSFLQNLSFEDFEEILLISSMIVKLLCSNFQKLDPHYSTLIFALLAPLGIRQIISSPVMMVLPHLSHALLHKTNILLKSINLSDTNQTYVVDIEGQFLILPIKNIVKAFAKEIMNSLVSIIKLRASSNQSEPNAANISGLSNKYGELWMIDFINSHIDGNPYKLESLSSSFWKESNEYKEYVKNKKNLEKIISLAEGDQKSLNFIKEQNKKELASLQNEIEKYKTARAENKDNVLNLVIEKYSFMPKAEINITRIARHALFCQAQILMDLSEKTHDSAEIVRNLLTAYELCKLSGYSVYFHEMLKQRLKPTISLSNEKVFKNHLFYQYAVAYLDIDFYFEQGAFEEISTSILSLLHAQFFEMEAEQTIKLIEKAVVCWAISLGKPIKLSKTHDRYFPTNTKVKKNKAVIKGIVQGKMPSIAAELFEWTAKTLGEINKSESNAKSKSKLASRIYEFLPILIRYGAPNALFESMMKMQLNREFELIGITSEIQEIVSIMNFEALEDYQAVNQTLAPTNREIMVIHQEMISEEESLIRHNTSWISEVKLFAIHHEQAYKIRKLKSYRKKLRNPNISQLVLFSTLSSRVKNSQILKEDWEKSKNYSAVISVIEKLQTEINECNYKESLKKSLDFHYLLKQMNTLLSVFCNVSTFIASPDLDSTELIEKSIQEVDASIKRLNVWKNVIIPKNKEIEIKQQKKWNFMWRQELLNKRKKGLKRQELLAKKRDALKIQ